MPSALCNQFRLAAASRATICAILMLGSTGSSWCRPTSGSVIENHSIEAQSKRPTRRMGPAMSILWTIIIGFVAGLIAKFLHPGNKNEPSGFILTTLLGIAGAFVATFLGQALGWYHANEGAGLIGAVVGAIIVLVVWGMFAPRNRAV